MAALTPVTLAGLNKVIVSDALTGSGTEDTLVITDGVSNYIDRLVTIVSASPWYWSSATGAVTTKNPVLANQFWTFLVKGTLSLWLEAGSGTPTLKITTLQ